MTRQTGSDALVEFAYLSEVAADLPPAVLIRLARQSWSFNTRHGVTGILRFDKGRFWQVVEGKCSVILPLASRILTDRRHRSINIEAFRAISTRRYTQWTTRGIEMSNEMRVLADGTSAIRLMDHPVAQASNGVRRLCEAGLRRT